MKKKILSIVLVLTLVLSLSVTVFGDSGGGGTMQRSTCDPIVVEYEIES